MRIKSLLLWSAIAVPSVVAPERWKSDPLGASVRLASDTLRQVLEDNTVVIFSRASCSASKRVKSYFEDLGIPYYALELDQRVDGTALQHALADHAGSKKTPTVFIRGVLVGGSYDVGRAFKSGELKHWTDADAEAIINPAARK